jgi:peptidoglycan/LPS O-acetylase OafA/YrhL
MQTDTAAAAPLAREIAKRRYQALDGARGIAAIAVLTTHWDRLLTPIVFAGAQRAVDLFFMMSGFVLALNYDHRLGRTMSVRDFMARRVIRLWPMQAVGTALTIVGVALALLIHAPLSWTWETLLLFAACNLLFLPGPPVQSIGFTLFPLNIPMWSLFWEVAANAVYAALRPLLGSALLLAITLGSAAALLASIITYGSAAGGWDWPSFPQGVLRVTFGFFFGVLLFRLHRDGRVSLPVPPWIALVAIVAVLWIPTIAGSRALADAVLVVGVLPVLVAALVANEPRRGGRAMAMLGILSYPLYALHYPVQRYAAGFLEKISHRNVEAFAPFLGLALLALLAIACLFAERWIDLPLRTALDRVRRRIAGDSAWPGR